MIKLLIPTDFSTNALNAISYALQLFKNQQCAIFLMHAFHDEIHEAEIPLSEKVKTEVKEMIENRSVEQLEHSLALIKKNFSNPNHSFRIICENNKLIDEADRIVNDHNIDLLVMGTKGKTNNRKLTFGSNTLKVLKYVKCPVLAVPENYKYSEPKRFLFPTNFLVPYKLRELKLLGLITNEHDAFINLFNVSTAENFSSRELKNQDFIKNGIDSKKINITRIKSRNVLEAIFNAIEKDKADVLVMVNTKHSFLEDILFKSNIDELSLNVKVPFLALQNMNRN